MKKILSMVLVLVLALSCFAMAGVSAEEFTPSEEPVIYFEVPEHWGEFTKVFCHIWEYGVGSPLANWQSKKESCTATETDRVYSYDISKVGGLEEGKMYCVIFSVAEGSQTYDCLMDTNCFGDTLYCDGTIYENPQDSSKFCEAAFWKHQDKLKYGPILQITSIGNITGTALPPGATVESVVTDFVSKGTLENALEYSGKTEEEILKDIATALNITYEEIVALVEAARPSTDDETSPDESFILGDADSDGRVNVKDATAIQKHVADMEVTIHIGAADADQDQRVNVKDATAIQKFAAGMEVPNPLGQTIVVTFIPLKPIA